MELPEISIPLVIGVAAAGLFVLSLVGLPMQLRVYRGASRRRPQDVSDQTHLQPPEISTLVRQLEATGFRRLGEAQLEVEGTGFSAVSWLMVDAEETTQAEIVGIGQPMVALGSYFGDRSVVTTSYPGGERIRDPNIVWTTVKSSIADAVARHGAEVSEFAKHHGRPVRIATMADYLRWDAIDRELYSVKRLRRPFLKAQLLPLVAYGAAAACILSGYFGWP